MSLSKKPVAHVCTLRLAVWGGVLVPEGFCALYSANLTCSDSGRQIQLDMFRR